MFGSSRRIVELCLDLLTSRAPFPRVLDFGSGDGWFAKRFLELGVGEIITPVDVSRRKVCYVEPTLYTGTLLPFESRLFDLVYSIDVLHHCSDPMESLDELLRCAKGYLLIKDHTYETLADRLLLCCMDEVANRAKGVKCCYAYQQRWLWLDHIVRSGFCVESLLCPAPIHSNPIGCITNRLQFIALCRRIC